MPNPNANSNFNLSPHHRSGINQQPLSPEWTTLDTTLIKRALMRLAEQENGQKTTELETMTLPETMTLHCYGEVTSTNEILWNYLQTGAKAGTVVIAQRQSAGRGQRGRQWQSGLGGLYLSLSLTPNLPAQNAAHLILCVVTGVAIALRAHQISVGIKWPNDLVFHPPNSDQLYKLGGILTETRIQGQRISQAVVGIGLNGANAVPEPGISLVTALSHSSQTHLSQSSIPTAMSLNTLAAIAISGIMMGWHTLRHQGIEAIVNEYNTLLVHRDRIITLEQDGYSQRYKVMGVTDFGALQVSPISDAMSFPTLASPSPSSSSEAVLEFPFSTLQLGYHLNSQ